MHLQECILCRAWSASSKRCMSSMRFCGYRLVYRMETKINYSNRSSLSAAFHQSTRRWTKISAKFRPETWTKQRHSKHTKRISTAPQVSLKGCTFWNMFIYSVSLFTSPVSRREHYCVALNSLSGRCQRGRRYYERFQRFKWSDCICELYLHFLFHDFTNGEDRGWLQCGSFECSQIPSKSVDTRSSIHSMHSNIFFQFSLPFTPT